MHSLQITKEALGDIEEAFDYYEAIQEELGERFRLSLLQRFKDLQLHPQHYGFINEDPDLVFRDIMLRRFPYRIVFRIHQHFVVVVAVFHASLNPAKLLGRIGQ